jgi:hypothetical protein
MTLIIQSTPTAGCPPGYSIIAGTTPDPAEPDDDIAHAKTMIASGGDGFELQYRTDILSANARTIDISSDVDVFTITLPAYGGVIVQVAVADTPTARLNATLLDDGGNAIMPSSENYCNGTISVLDSACILYNLDLLSFYLVANRTNASKTVYIRFNGRGDTGYYVPFYYSIGQDADGDYFYSQGVPGTIDCNDNDINVYPTNGC